MPFEPDSLNRRGRSGALADRAADPCAVDLVVVVQWPLSVTFLLETVAGIVAPAVTGEADEDAVLGIEASDAVAIHAADLHFESGLNVAIPDIEDGLTVARISAAVADVSRAGVMPVGAPFAERVQIVGLDLCADFAAVGDLAVPAFVPLSLKAVHHGAARGLACVLGGGFLAVGGELAEFAVVGAACGLPAVFSVAAPDLVRRNAGGGKKRSC